MTLLLPLDVATAAPVLTVDEVTTTAAFLALEKEWNALVRAKSDEPFYRHEHIRAWLDSFAPHATLVVLTARDAAGRLVAALPLLAQRDFVCGFPTRQLVSVSNTHSCRSDMLAEEPESAGPAFLAHLLERRGWDVLRLHDVPEGGNAWHIHRAAQAAGLPVGAWESQRSPYLLFPSSHEELLAGKSAQFRANLRRRRRQLERLGRVTFDRVTDRAGLEAHLEEVFALERSGWKGERHTAIAQDRSARMFYTRFAEEAARRGYLSLFFMRVDGKPVAAHYGLTYDGVYSVPKLAYDEALKGCSPGLVLVEEAIKDGITRGLRGYDFLGTEARWKNDWSTGVRPHHWLFVFRDTAVGRALQKAKFDWVPAARRLLLGRKDHEPQES
jgi:CelD/BcsL family acetyltransferase involved in cellulose biosynthesis